MGFLHRLGYYLGGFSVGLILLFFLFNGKRTQCNYGPQARVLNDLSKKEWILNAEQSNSIDSLTIDRFIKHSTIDFGASSTRLDSCKIYVLRLENSLPSTLTVQNCTEKVFVLTYD